MKKKQKVYLIIVIIMVIIGVVVYKSNTKIDMSYGRIEYIQSINEIKEGFPTVIMFRKPYSDECLEMERTFRKIYDEHEGELNLVYYNIEDYGNNEVMTAIENYSIKAVPTMVFLDKDGMPKAKEEGVLTQESATNILNKIRSSN